MNPAARSRAGRFPTRQLDRFSTMSRSPTSNEVAQGRVPIPISGGRLLSGWPYRRVPKSRPPPGVVAPTAKPPGVSRDESASPCGTEPSALVSNCSYRHLLALPQSGCHSSCIDSRGTSGYAHLSCSRRRAEHDAIFPSLGWPFHDRFRRRRPNPGLAVANVESSRAIRTEGRHASRLRSTRRRRESHWVHLPFRFSEPHL